MKVNIRPWTLADVSFSLHVRNHPECMRYFRQNSYLTKEGQLEFIKADIGDYGIYNGNIIEADGAPAGLCGVKTTGEFTIAILPEFQHKGVATQAMQQLIKREHTIWSEVFVGNPALEWFIGKLGFKVCGVRERAYYKPELGLVDVVKIIHESLPN